MVHMGHVALQACERGGMRRLFVLHDDVDGLSGMGVARRPNDVVRQLRVIGKSQRTAQGAVRFKALGHAILGPQQGSEHSG